MVKKKILLGGAGGAPTNNVIWSLKESGDEFLVGVGATETDLLLSETHQTIYVPSSRDSYYKQYMLKILKTIRPDFIHFQNDFEILTISSFRDEIEELGIKLFMPDHSVIENCVYKQKSYALWEKNDNIKVPKTIILYNENDLHTAFDLLGKKLWIRAIEGGAGRGALPTTSYELAKNWIDHFQGWGEFTASECLSEESITWMSIWFKGELIVAQTRKRQSWNFGNRTLSGVTGITGVGITCSDEAVNDIAQSAIYSVCLEPHGIFSVDLTYDNNGIPNPTEINIARFFTTSYFFTSAGINFPRIYVDIALYNKFPKLERKINPLPNDLMWIRGMDIKPTLIDKNDFNLFKEKIKKRGE